MIEICAVQTLIYDQRLGIGRGPRLQPAEDLFLECVFLFIGKLETGMIDDLDAVVAVRIVRSGDHNARREWPGLGHVRQTRSRDQTCETRLDSTTFQTSRHVLRDPRSALARIHTDDHFRIEVTIPN